MEPIIIPPLEHEGRFIESYLKEHQSSLIGQAGIEGILVRCFGRERLSAVLTFGTDRNRGSGFGTGETEARKLSLGPGQLIYAYTLYEVVDRDIIGVGAYAVYDGSKFVTVDWGTSLYGIKPTENFITALLAVFIADWLHNKRIP